MKLQATLRFASFFAMTLAASLHAASVIQFATASFTIAENAGQATITAQRTEDLDTPVNVDYATANGKATNGLKYTAVSGTLAFGANVPWLESHGYHHQVAPRSQSAARRGMGNSTVDLNDGSFIKVKIFPVSGLPGD